MYSTRLQAHPAQVFSRACKELGTWAIGVDSDQYAYYKEVREPGTCRHYPHIHVKRTLVTLLSLSSRRLKTVKLSGANRNSLGLSDNAVGYVDNDFFGGNCSGRTARSHD